MNWNPMMGPLPGLFAGQQFKENQLGAGVTLGNPQAQEDYVAQLARALADSGAAGDLMDRATALKDSGWIDNSGIAGVAERMFNGWASKKMSQKARDQQADAETRRMTAQEQLDERKAMRDAERSEKLTTRERTRRQSLAQQMGLNNREAVEFIETGKVPNATRGVPMMTNQGLVNVNPETGEYTEARPAGQREPQQQLPPNVRLDPNMSPEDRAAAMADIQAGAPDGDQSYNITKPQQGGPLMPYEKPPSAIELEKLDLMRRSAGRADAAETRAQEAARRAAEAAEKKANAPNAALSQWVEARKGLEEGLGRTTTGPIAGRLPAFTTDQQIAEGSVAVTAPILKQLFRTAGEGTFTDKDQELLMQMVPTRNDTEEARKWKIENMDRVIRAKLGAGATAPAPAAGDGALTPDEQRELEDLRKRLGR